MTFNQLLWDCVNWAGWYFWLPFVGYGIYGLSKMYRLSAAANGMGRLIRVLFTTAFLCLVFSPQFNGIGPFAFHLLAIGVCLWLRLTYAEYVRDGKIKPATAPTVIERMAERTVVKQ